MEKQKKLIEKKDWDCLIILDACRYDYFKEVYTDYLKGELRKVLSAGSNTTEWKKNTFDKKQEDIVYISANPQIRSISDKTKKLEYNTGYHFHEIIDIWKQDWNENFGTVLPSDVSKVTRHARIKYMNKKLIAHFMQPHYPYLSLDPIEEKNKNLITKIKNNHSLLKFLYSRGRGVLDWLVGGVLSEKLMDSLRIKRERVEERVAKKYGKETLKKAYLNNLKTVLKEVKNLSDRLPGKIVVTSDHGEFLGENGVYAHMPYANSSILKEVPWLKIRE
ncbi:hypothetical protein AKJ51_04350 [candidate division MSBL1 archaeon SCGC-AAA382A20]|uniref:Sulfatase N-terminal domain-containing protein n=1 Tax=candidate division MSBL1 archaeon SCGC-AAA382A20 TaxID=1698280 RepID=A0A133VHV6_9EURY|nr:hypothetical protein AKJ51_04350 [candidate division MSBL1 archaeon SCGC-AAA382A20]